MSEGRGFIDVRRSIGWTLRSRRWFLRHCLSDINLSAGLRNQFVSRSAALVRAKPVTELHTAFTIRSLNLRMSESPPNQVNI